MKIFICSLEEVKDVGAIYISVCVDRMGGCLFYRVSSFRECGC